MVAVLSDISFSVEVILFKFKIKSTGRFLTLRLWVLHFLLEQNTEPNTATHTYSWNYTFYDHMPFIKLKEVINKSDVAHRCEKNKTKKKWRFSVWIYKHACMRSTVWSIIHTFLQTQCVKTLSLGWSSVCSIKITKPGHISNCSACYLGNEGPIISLVCGLIEALTLYCFHSMVYEYWHRQLFPALSCSGQR